MKAELERAHESLMSCDDAMLWAEAYYREHHRWPSRRFRVETTTMGNSRLLTQRTAESSAARYGGELVELIPPRHQFLKANNINRWSHYWDEAQDLGPCPRCNSPKSVPCRTPGGRNRSPHKARGEVS